jgi:hypothetical protein
VLIGGAPFFFALWGLPFLLVGSHRIFGRFLIDAKQRAKTTYGLTSERIVIVSGLFARNVKSLNLRTLSDVSLNERPDGSGTITFGQGHPYSSWFQGMGWWPGMPAAASAFEMIPRAKEGLRAHSQRPADCNMKPNKPFERTGANRFRECRRCRAGRSAPRR